jgi:hypothetical protein
MRGACMNTSDRRQRTAILINEMGCGPAVLLVGGRLVTARPAGQGSRRMPMPVREVSA